MVKLNPPVKEKATEEIRSGNYETAQDKRMESDVFLWFLMGRNISYSFAPMNLFTRLLQILFYQPKKMEVVALTWSPPSLLRWLHVPNLLTFRLAG